MTRQERIDIVMIKLAKLWKECPYLRLGQLFEILSRGCCSFHIDDSIMEGRIDEINE